MDVRNPRPGFVQALTNRALHAGTPAPVHRNPMPNEIARCEACREDRGNNENGIHVAVPQPVVPRTLVLFLRRYYAHRTIPARSG